jgi:hypothetical protein
MNRIQFHRLGLENEKSMRMQECVLRTEVIGVEIWKRVWISKVNHNRFGRPFRILTARQQFLTSSPHTTRFSGNHPDPPHLYAHFPAMPSPPASVAICLHPLSFSEQSSCSLFIGFLFSLDNSRRFSSQILIARSISFNYDSTIATFLLHLQASIPLLMAHSVLTMQVPFSRSDPHFLSFTFR